jgi:hypothetical protein
MNSVPGVITFESKVCDSSLGGSFLPSLSNSSRNLDSSAAYHTTPEKNSQKRVNQTYASFQIFQQFPREIKVERISVTYRNHRICKHELLAIVPRCVVNHGSYKIVICSNSSTLQCYSTTIASI